MSERRKTLHDMRPTPLWAKAIILLALAFLVLGSAYVLLLMPRARPAADTPAPLPTVGG